MSLIFCDQNIISNLGVKIILNSMYYIKEINYKTFCIHLKIILILIFYRPDDNCAGLTFFLNPLTPFLQGYTDLLRNSHSPAILNRELMEKYLEFDMVQRKFIRLAVAYAEIESQV